MNISFDPNRQIHHASHAQLASEITQDGVQARASKVDALIVTKFPPVHRHNCTAFADYSEKMYLGGRNVHTELTGYEENQLSVLFNKKAVGRYN